MTISKSFLGLSALLALIASSALAKDPLKPHYGGMRVFWDGHDRYIVMAKPELDDRFFVGDGKNFDQARIEAEAARVGSDDFHVNFVDKRVSAQLDFKYGKLQLKCDGKKIELTEIGETTAAGLVHHGKFKMAPTARGSKAVSPCDEKLKTEAQAKKEAEVEQGKVTK